MPEDTARCFHPSDEDPSPGTPVLGCWVAESESEASWGEVFAELKQRGLSGVRYVVSDDHAGMAYNLKRIVKVLGATGATQALAAA